MEKPVQRSLGRRGTDVRRNNSLPDLAPSEIYQVPTSTPYAGRLGGNQEFVLNRNDASNASALDRVPDAAPFIPLAESLALRGFQESRIWTAAIIEGWGTLMFVWITGWIGIRPAGVSAPPSGSAGVFATAAFLGPLVGGITNVILVALFIYSFGTASGGHFNPSITFATFLARLTSLPRLILYVAFQTAGAAVAGMLLRVSYGTREYTVGGCGLDPSAVPVGEAWTIEFMASCILLFLAFGVGLDPRQREVFGPALGPIYIGLLVGVLSWGTAFSRPGHNGASLNPARCFGVFVGSRFPVYHWIHWVAPAAAGVIHGVGYFFVPPWVFAKAPIRP